MHLRGYAHRLNERFFDWRFGIRTSEFHEQHDKTRPDFRGYAPTFYGDWRIIRRHLLVNQDSAFIDYGAGLGRVVILAAQLPFARVIGIEFSSDLARRGCANIRSAKHLLKASASMVCVDATRFKVPTDVSVVFIANSFAGDVLLDTLEQVRRSYLEKPRTLQIACNQPPISALEHDIARADWLTLAKTIPLSHARKCLFYSPR